MIEETVNEDVLSSLNVLICFVNSEIGNPLMEAMSCKTKSAAPYLLMTSSLKSNFSIEVVAPNKFAEPIKTEPPEFIVNKPPVVISNAAPNAITPAPVVVRLKMFVNPV